MTRALLPLLVAALAAGCAHRSGGPPRAAPGPAEPATPPPAATPAAPEPSAAAPAAPEPEPEPHPSPPTAPEPEPEPQGAAPAEPPAAAREAPPEPALEPPRKPEVEARPAPVERETPPTEQNWLDVGHAFLEQKMYAPVVRFDRFFSDERDLEAERSRSFLRVRTEVRVRDDGPPLVGASVSANLRLPGLAQRLRDLRLVITGEADDTRDALFPEPGPLKRNPVGRANAELRYGLWDGLVAHADLGAGVLLRFPPGLFTRARLRYVLPLPRHFLARLANTGFWRTDTGWGDSVDADLERPLGPASLVRLGSSGVLTEKSLGVEWVSELALLRSLGPRSAVRLAAAAQSRTRVPVLVEKYRVYTRFRRDFYRRWIFFELEPEVAWPWNGARSHERELAFTFRLEVQFQGNEPPDAPPAD